MCEFGSRDATGIPVDGAGPAGPVGSGRIADGALTLSLAGVRVFIVEDEVLILDTLQDMLEDLGCTVAGSAIELDDALAQAGALAIDIAILDVNVAGKRIDPVADLLASRGIPFFFTTGYGRGSLAARHQDRVVVAKPYRKADLAAALAAVRPA
jgi:CheY-like chemotaxis protein